MSCGSGGGSIGIDDIPARYAAAVCAKMFACCSADQLVFRDESMCRDSTESLYRYAIMTPQASVAAGYSTFRADRFKACIAALDSSSCGSLSFDWSFGPLAMIPACGEFFAPRSQIGQTCLQHEDCVDGYCARPDGGSLGGCAPLARDAGPCASQGECGADRFWGSGRASYCDATARICQPKKAGDAACAHYYECASGACASDGDVCVPLSACPDF